MEGIIKQQCIDEKGLYNWQKKFFKINANSELEVSPISLGEIGNTGHVSIISLQGAKYAKEWSFASALSGFGFDLLWMSGKNWSFLVDDEQICQAWVTAINEAINRINQPAMETMNHHFHHNSVNNSQELQAQQAAAAQQQLQLLQEHQQFLSGNHQPNTQQRSSYPSSLHGVYDEHNGMTESKQANTPIIKPLPLPQHYFDESTIPHNNLTEHTTTLDLNTLHSLRPQPVTQYRSVSSTPSNNNKATHRYSQQTQDNNQQQQQEEIMRSSTNRNHNGYPPMPSAPSKMAQYGAQNSMPQYPQTPQQQMMMMMMMTNNTVNTVSAQQHPLRSSHPPPQDQSLYPQYQQSLPPPQPQYNMTTTSVTASGSNALPPPPAASLASSSSLKTDRERNAYLENMRSLFATTKRSLIDNEQAIHQSLRESHPQVPSQQQTAIVNNTASAQAAPEVLESISGLGHVMADHLTSQIRVQHLEQVLQNKEKEMEAMQAKYYNNTMQSENLIKKLQSECDEYRQREHDVIAKFQSEIDHRVLKASNDNSSYYEASLKALNLQHQRELSLLQEELQEQRKVMEHSKDKESTQRKRLEHSEITMRKELEQAHDQINELEITNQQLTHQLETIQQSITRDRNKLIHEYENKMTALQSDLSTLTNEYQSNLQIKLQEMSKKYEFTLQNMKLHEIELMKNEYEQEKIRSILEIQKKCQVDIEKIRLEERTLAAQEMDNLRSAFIQREHHTAEDLIELEKLHAKRIQQLEMSLGNEKQHNEELRCNLAEILLEKERQSKDIEYKSDSWQKKTHDITLQYDTLKRNYETLQDEILNVKNQEHSHHEQLRSLSMEYKLQSAEKQELQRQLSNAMAEAIQWKKVVQEQEKNYANIETSDRVNKEEIHYLELENHRLKQENLKLKHEIEKSERLIYGHNNHFNYSNESVSNNGSCSIPKPASQLNLQHHHHNNNNVSDNISTFSGKDSPYHSSSRQPVVHNVSQASITKSAASTPVMERTNSMKSAAEQPQHRSSFIAGSKRISK